MFSERQRLPRALDLPIMVGCGAGAAFFAWVGWSGAFDVPRLVAAVAVGVLLVLGFCVEMRVRVRDDAVTLALTPFYRKTLTAPALTAARLSRIDAFRQAGGLGLRWLGPGRIALVVRGHACVELTTTRGTTYLIGTEHPEELLGALRESGVPVTHP